MIREASLAIDEVKIQRPTVKQFVKEFLKISVLNGVSLSNPSTQGSGNTAAEKVDDCKDKGMEKTKPRELGRETGGKHRSAPKGFQIFMGELGMSHHPNPENICN